MASSMGLGRLRENRLMMRYAFLTLLFIATAACDEAMMSGSDCGAAAMQPLVGKDAVEIAKFIATQPAHVRSNAYYIGQKEELGSDIPNNALIVKLDKDEVHEAKDLLGAKTLELFCNL